MDWIDVFGVLVIGSFFAFFSYGFITIMGNLYVEMQSITSKSWLEYLFYVITYPFYVLAEFLEEDIDEYLHKKYVEKKRAIPNKKLILWFLLWYIYCYLSFTGILPMWLRFI